ncbi:MAG TPA: TIGR00159 family protein [Bacteroidetes bacterium]|nr:TIGR00159 family protein [Bacteroidota bacterium]HDZ12439.1 TIGR00159 family protein [Bacteroidota bacterium]
MTLFRIDFLRFTIIDLLDILVISYILYRLYLLIRGTRAIQIIAGWIIILLTSLVAKILDMKTLSWIFESLSTIWLVAFVIVFQPELRRMLLYLGNLPLIRRFVRISGSKVINEVVKAAAELSNLGFGGLIVLTREMGLRGIIETGIQLQAEVSAPLIISIFNPLSPLHDGALIIQNELIEAAKCILPLSQSDELEPWYGTRHRAALGLSEESDAVIIVVSEETHYISVAMTGKLIKNVKEDELQEVLEKSFKVEG